MKNAITFDLTVGSRSNIYSIFWRPVLVEEEVLQRHTRITDENAITFDLTVGSRSNIYSIFWRPVSLHHQWNPYSWKRRSYRARPE